MTKLMGIIILLVILSFIPSGVSSKASLYYYYNNVNKGDTYEWKVTQSDLNLTQLCDNVNPCSITKFDRVQLGDTYKAVITKTFDVQTSSFSDIFEDYYDFYYNNQLNNVSDSSSNILSTCLGTVFEIQMGSRNIIQSIHFIMMYVQWDDETSNNYLKDNLYYYSNSTVYGLKYTSVNSTTLAYYDFNTDALLQYYHERSGLILNIKLISEDHTNPTTHKSSLGNGLLYLIIPGLLVADFVKIKKMRFKRFLDREL